MPENRRVKKTKKMLKDAILTLLETRGLEQITVTDICHVADVNRSTFYAHYADARQLLREIEDDMLNHMPRLPVPYSNSQEQQSYKPLVEYLQYVQQNARMIRIMFVRRDDGAFFNRAVHALMEAAGIADDPDAFLMRYDCAYRLNGTIGIVREWIKDNFPISAEELAKIIWYRRINAQIEE